MAINWAQILNRKKLILLITLLCLIALINFFWPTVWYKYELYKINNITDKDLSNTYSDTNKGFAFNYLKEGEVYKPFRGTDENSLRVFSERTSADGFSNKGAACDIRLKDDSNIIQDAQNVETVVFNNIEWKKWKVIRNTGDIFDPHFVFWYTENGQSKIRFTSTIEVEGYCEAIISTFRFLN